jgi:hypothetical protein
MLPIANVDLSAITSIESDPITGTVYTATTSVTDHQVPPDESGHRIRAYSDLYGWVFRPKFDKQGRTLSVGVSFVCNMDFKYTVPNHVLQTWIDSSLQSIQHIHHYLTHYGCPPYIRRVAGKVIREGFDALTNNYQIVFIAKHQPSNSYRARKQQQPQQSQSLWCTDIRFHKTMFPHGLDISVIPENVARIDVSPKEQRSIKIFTTDENIDGKQVTFTLMPLSLNDDGTTHHYTTYKYNGELFVQGKQQQQSQVEQNNNSSSIDDYVEEEQESPKPTVIAKNATVVVENAEASSILADKKSAAEEQVVADAKVAIEATKLVAVVTAPQQPATPAPAAQGKSKYSDTKAIMVLTFSLIIAVPTIQITKAEIIKDEKSAVEDDETLPLKVPKGYLLVPEHQVKKAKK